MIVRPAQAPLPRGTHKPAPATDPASLYAYFLQQQEGHDADHLAFLDRGIEQSYLQDHLALYPARLSSLRPSERSEVSPPFPKSGQLPAIADQGLEFLHPQVSHACLAVGDWESGTLATRWLGRKALESAQLWSATKVFPMLRTCVQAGSQTPLAQASIQDSKGAVSLPLQQVFDSIVSYREGTQTSNAHARMLKHFDTPWASQNWLHSCTGNRHSEFQGGYGHAATIARPLLVDDQGNPLLAAAGAEHKGRNLVSVYDLCRTMGQLGWDAHLPTESKLEGVTSGLPMVQKALGQDSARFLEAAWEALGLDGRIENPVVLSKMGFGLSDERGQWEEVYAAFVQFGDRQTGRQHQFSLALKVAQKPQGDRTPQELDALMATQIALVVQKIIQGEV